MTHPAVAARERLLRDLEAESWHLRRGCEAMAGPWHSNAAIVIEPGLRGGDPCILGSGLRAEALALAWWHRRDADEWSLAGDFRLTRDDLVIACWFQSRYGTPTWRRRWRAWAERYAELLWRGRLSMVPMPPREPLEARP